VAKYLVVNSCEECPKLYEGNGDKLYCEELDEEVTVPEVLRVDCPLEEYRGLNGR